jgi:hypothetical protein
VHADRYLIAKDYKELATTKIKDNILTGKLSN